MIANREAQLQSLLDRQAIRDALAEYCRGIDRVAPDLIRSAYHADSWDHHGPFAGPGADFATGSTPASHRAAPSNVASHHLLGQSHIELAGDVARCETYFWCTGLRATGQQDRRLYYLAGRYLDRFERREERWRISVRRTVVDLSGEAPEGIPWPSAEAYARGARWPDDAVFRFDELVVGPEPDATS